MARLLTIAPLFRAPPRFHRDYIIAVFRALFLYALYAVVIFICVFPWPHYGTVYENYWNFLDRSLIIGLVIVLGVPWAISILFALFLPYPELQNKTVRQEQGQTLQEHAGEPKEQIEQEVTPSNSQAELPNIVSVNDDTVSEVSEVDLESQNQQPTTRSDKQVHPKDCAVLIPTHNSAAVIAETIQAAAKYFPYKVITVNRK